VYLQTLLLYWNILEGPVHPKLPNFDDYLLEMECLLIFVWVSQRMQGILLIHFEAKLLPLDTTKYTFLSTYEPKE
jgi:hypothetical protein